MREYHLELVNLIIVANNNINFKTKEKKLIKDQRMVIKLL